MAISPGGRPINYSPLSSSKTDNWVARAGGLPPYIRGVARGIAKNHGGKVTSKDIQIALGKMKVWAAGGDSVTPPVQAAAAKALAEWEALRAKAHADLAHDIVHGLIDLAAVNKHHVPGTAYHWKHGYIPLDARTATLWKKKHFAERLTREGKLTSHEPEGIRNETDRRNAYATRELGIEAVKREAAKVIAAKPEEPKTPETPKGGLTKEARAAAKDYVEKYRLLRVANEKRTWDTSKHENAVDEAAKVLKTQHGIDVSVPEAMPKGQSTVHSNGVETVTYTTDDYAQSRKWRETHEANVSHLHELSGAPAPKSRYGTRYGWKNSDLISLRAHLGKNPDAAPAKKRAAKPDTRTPAEVLAKPKKGDTVFIHATGGQKITTARNGYTPDEPVKWVYTGSTWRMQKKGEDGSFTDATSYSPKNVTLKKDVMLYQASKVGTAANPDTGHGEVSPEDIRATMFSAEAEAATARNAALHAGAKKLGGDLPSGWTAVSPVEATGDLRKRQGAVDNSPEKNMLAARNSLLHSSQKDTFTYLHPSGKQVRVQKGHADQQKLHALLNAVSQAHDETKHTSLGDESKPVIYHVGANKHNKGAWGFVFQGDDTNVHLNPDLLAHHANPAADNSKVDLGRNTSQLYHTLVHEMGHVLHNRDYSDGARAQLDHSHHKAAWEGHTYGSYIPTDENHPEGKFKYGSKNPFEGFAEAFSQHINDLHHPKASHHTSTLSGIADSYAQRYGWKSSSRKEATA